MSSTLIDTFLRKLNLHDSHKVERSPLEKYTIIREINHGAFSKVYKAKVNETGEYVALKKMSKKKLTMRQKENILREASIHKTLNHPNIVRFIEFFQTEEEYVLVLELMNGGELFERIEKVEYLTESDARIIIRDVALGIKYLHDNGIVHRDIKPENIVFATVGLTPVKLCDFGLSKILTDNVTETPCGTVGYLAPEIAKEMAHNYGVDMWGLGCVLYAMLCGFPAFYDPNIHILTAKVKTGDFDFPAPWWDDVSESAKDLIRHCLRVDPRKRYNINEFLRHPWMMEDQKPVLPLKSPAMFRSGEATINFKSLFDVTMATHRDLMDEDEVTIPPPSTIPVKTNKKAFILGNASQSTLLAKRAAH